MAQPIISGVALNNADCGSASHVLECGTGKRGGSLSVDAEEAACVACADAGPLIVVEPFARLDQRADLQPAGFRLREAGEEVSVNIYFLHDVLVSSEGASVMQLCRDAPGRSSGSAAGFRRDRTRRRAVASRSRCSSTAPPCDERGARNHRPRRNIIRTCLPRPRGACAR